jgi:hypothetical protein
VDIELSDVALTEFDRLESEDPDRHQLLVDDLALLAHLGLNDSDRWARLLGFDYCQGPTGRVRYWISRERDRAVIEFFDLD